ncbi:MAG TPA: serine hydrolase domain-containing protein [Candidatus Methylacidiphilales bacterium]|nr:serine hydrolase domain-containing protein [Candidatus Methylacidiphilales bacterium]
MSWITFATLTVALSACLLFGTRSAADDAIGPVMASLENIRIECGVPALGAAIFTGDGLKESVFTGTRKRNELVPVTANDLWHLGSDTKVMTAMLLGTYVAEGRVHWDDKVIGYFPGLVGQVTPGIASVTLSQILSHQAGMADSLKWTYVPGDSLPAQRQSAAALALKSPAWPPGTYHYSNFDYVIAGAIVEKISGRPWEALMRERIFKPLGITSAGFGGLGTPGKIDEPWPHNSDGTPLPQNGPAIDNPPVLGPAGTVHMTMADWARFLSDQLRGARGEKALLPHEIYVAIQTPRIAAGPGMQYGFGWGIVSRPWAGGTAFTHAGSNNMNYCVAWLAPKKDFGVLAVCNQGGAAGAKACDEAVGLLIQQNARLLNR